MWLGILIALLVGVVVLLAIPVDITFTLQSEKDLQARLTIGWLFGLLRIPVHPEDGESGPAASSQQTGRKRDRRGLHPGAMLLSQGFLARLIRLLRRLKDCIHIRSLRLHLLLGLDDPADTGRLWGMLGPLTLAHPAPAVTDLVIQPEFTGAAFQIDGAGVVRILPIEVLGTLLAFALSPVTLRALYALGTGR